MLLRSSRCAPLLLVLLAACSREVPTQQGWEFAPGSRSLILDSARTIDTAAVFMAAAGCSRIPGSQSEGTILVPVLSYGYRAFRCPGISRDSMHAISRSFVAWVSGLVQGEHTSASNTSWDIGVDDVFDCDDYANGYSIGANRSYQIVNEDGWVVASGYSGPDGLVVKLAFRCLPGQHATAWGIIGLASGWPMDPQPPFHFDGKLGDGSAPPPPDSEEPPPPIESIDIAPGGLSTTVGEVSGTFQATAYSGGSPINVSLVWSCGDPAIAVKDDDGTCLGVAQGVTTVTARIAGSAVVGFAIIEVVPTRSSADSNCKATADTTPVAASGLVPDSRLPGYGPLGDLGLVKQVSAIDRGAHTGEAGGFIFFNVTKKEYVFQQMPNLLTVDAACKYEAGDLPTLWTVAPNGDSLYFLARAHTHPPFGQVWNYGECHDDNGTDMHGQVVTDKVSRADSIAANSAALVLNTNYIFQSVAGRTQITRYGSVVDSSQVTVYLPTQVYLRERGASGCPARKT